VAVINVEAIWKIQTPVIDPPPSSIRFPVIWNVPAAELYVPGPREVPPNCVGIVVGTRRFAEEMADARSTFAWAHAGSSTCVVPRTTGDPVIDEPGQRPASPDKVVAPVFVIVVPANTENVDADRRLIVGTGHDGTVGPNRQSLIHTSVKSACIVPKALFKQFVTAGHVIFAQKKRHSSTQVNEVNKQPAVHVVYSNTLYEPNGHKRSGRHSAVGSTPFRFKKDVDNGHRQSPKHTESSKQGTNDVQSSWHATVAPRARFNRFGLRIFKLLRSVFVHDNS
jgi:hypothetical protein